MHSIGFLIRGAIDSKYNGRHWFRYLKKIIVNNEIILSKEEIQALLKSDKLTMFQKVTLSRAVAVGSPTYEYLKRLNQPATELKHYNRLKKRFSNLDIILRREMKNNDRRSI